MEPTTFDDFFEVWRSQKKERALSYPVIEWVNKHYISPELFWSELMIHLKHRGVIDAEMLKKREYNFYNQCIIRNFRLKSSALKTYDLQGKSTEWSYEDIHFLVNGQIDAWQKNVEPSDSVALVLPYGIEFLVSLFTALRLGLTIYYLPVDSPFLSHSQLTKKLEVFSPNLVIARSHDISHIPTQFSSIALDSLEKKKYGNEEEAYAYSPNDCVYTSTLSSHPIAAESLYQSALRDGEIVLGLRSKTRWAHPMSCSINEEPFFSIMSLLFGATLLHIPDEFILKNPQILKEIDVDLLGISLPLQRIFLEADLFPKKKPALCYRSPLDIDFVHWSKLAEHHMSKNTLIFDGVINSNGPGFILFSRPTLNKEDALLMPNLGIPWDLSQLDRSGEKSLVGYGIFTLLEIEKKQSDIILSQVKDQWAITGTVEPTLRGIPYPIQEIEENLRDLSFVLCSIILTVSRVHEHLLPYFTLIVFIRFEDQDKKENTKSLWTEQIETMIVEKVGRAFIPQKIEYFSTAPRMKKGSIDREWVLSQYQGGMLHKKEHLPTYRLLTQIRNSLTQEAINA